MIAMVAALLAGPLHGETTRATTWRYPRDHAWQDGTATKLVPAGAALALPAGAIEGSFQTRAVPLTRPYDRIVPCWNASTTDGTWVVVQARAHRAGKPITGWMTVATWNKTARGPRDAGDAEAKIDQDTIVVAKGADAVEIKAVLKRGSAARPSPRLVALGLTAFSSKDRPDADASSGGGAEQALPIAFRSQSTAAPGIAPRVCGPTSTSMALAYHGVNLTIDQVAALAKDPPGAIQFGNWAYLAATAAELGMDAEVRAMSSLDEVIRELKAGHPVIMAISFNAGELPGAPISKTAGHLILARGYDAEGNVLVNDPAGKTAHTGQIRYDRAALTRAWKRGIGIVIKKAQ